MASESDEFCPIPFPEGLPEIQLHRVSLTKLLNDDEEQCRLIYDICTGQGFFYLDLTDHPKGLKLLDDVRTVYRVAKDVYSSVSMKDKYTFKPRGSYETELPDTGYKELGLDEDGNCNKLELLNISQSGFFSGLEDYVLPPWLAEHEMCFRAILRDGNVIHNVILAVLEKQLGLRTGALTSLHKLTDSSGDFLRMLHYPAPKNGKPHEHPPTPAHRDAVSVALLFCWQGGLQITNSTAPVDHAVEEPEDTWYYVRPAPGHVLVNLGLAMQVLTNGVLKAGKHRVVTPPGEQGKFDRVSVLISARPKLDTLMRSLKSPKIPRGEFEEGEALTAKEWGVKQILKTVYNIRKQNNEPLDQ